MSVLIRNMRWDDVDAVCSMAAELTDAPHWPRAGYGAAVEKAETGRRVALVAEVSGDLAGFAVASLVPPEAELESIAVARQFQRRGIARALLACAARECEGSGCSQMFLEVRASNEAAQALYRATGFHIAGQRPGYYSSPAEDALLFRRQLFSGEK